MSPEESISLLQSPDAKKRYLAIQQTQVPLDSDQIEAGLTDAMAFIRAAVVHRFSRALTPDQIERAVTDPSKMVRAEVLMNLDIALTTPQIDRAASDPYSRVRYYATVLRRGAVSPDENDEQDLLASDLKPESLEPGHSVLTSDRADLVYVSKERALQKEEVQP